MSHIQIGEAYSPQIRPGEADALLGFELAEATRRGVTYLKQGGLAIVNCKKIPPVEVISGMCMYPSEKDLLRLLRQVSSRIAVIDATSLAEKAGDSIATNVVMLGALAASYVLSFGEKEITAVINESIPAKFLDLNIRAFKLGADAFKNS